MVKLHEWILCFLLLPIIAQANPSQIKSHGYDLDAAYEFANRYMPNHVGIVTLEASQLPNDVQSKSSLIKKFSISDDLARQDTFTYADACDKMVAYFSEERLLKMTFEVSGACD